MYYGKGLKPWQIAMLNQKKTMYFSKPAMQDNQNDSEIVKAVLDFYSDYHHHKENMAYSGVLLQIGLFAGIMVADPWPPKWIPDFGLCILQINMIVSLVLLFVWLLIHCFIGWQLQKRRYAAKINAAAIEFLASNDNSEHKSKTCCSRKNISKKSNKVIQFLSLFIWPINCSGKSDVLIGKPCRFAELISLHSSKISGTIIEEIILLSGSLIMLGLIFCRI